MHHHTPRAFLVNQIVSAGAIFEPLYFDLETQAPSTFKVPVRGSYILIQRTGFGMTVCFCFKLPDEVLPFHCPVSRRETM
jgi:hypothetical protein